MSAIEQKVVEIIEQLQSLAKPGIEVAATVVQMNAIGTLLFGVVGIVAAISACVIGKRKFKAFVAAEDAEYAGRGYSSTTDWTDAPHILIPFGILFMFGAMAAVVGLLDIWNYIALVNPELALAHEILSKIGK